MLEIFGIGINKNGFAICDDKETPFKFSISRFLRKKYRKETHTAMELKKLIIIKKNDLNDWKKLN